MSNDLRHLLGALRTSSPAQIPVVLAQYGLPVFPLASGTKIPHAGSNGLKDATTDAEKVAAHQAARPHDNWAMLTGHGIDILDIDTKNGQPGKKTLRRITIAGLAWPGYATTITPSGGWHLWLPSNGDRNHSGLDGLDYRGQGGYVLIPPSQIDRLPYTLTVTPPAAEAVAPISWTAIKEYLYPPPTRRPRANVEHKLAHDHGKICDWLATQETGNRNSSLFWAACKLFESGQDAEVLRETAHQIGLDDAEITATITSARNRTR